MHSSSLGLKERVQIWMSRKDFLDLYSTLLARDPLSTNMLNTLWIYLDKAMQNSNNRPEEKDAD